MPTIDERVRKILTELEDVREDLRAFSDDVWLSIDHNDQRALEAGVKFKTAYNEGFQAYDRATSDLSNLIQRYTSISIEASEQTLTRDRDPGENQRVIRELDTEKPHTLDEDFVYTRPYGFVL